MGRRRSHCIQNFYDSTFFTDKGAILIQSSILKYIRVVKSAIYAPVLSRLLSTNLRDFLNGQSALAIR